MSNFDKDYRYLKYISLDGLPFYEFHHRGWGLSLRMNCVRVTCSDFDDIVLIINEIL